MASEKTPTLRAVEPDEESTTLPIEEGTTPPVDEGVRPPIEVGDPEAVDEFAIDQSHLDDYATEEEGPTDVACEKPRKGVHFTTLTKIPGRAGELDRALYFLLEMQGRDPLLVTTAMAALHRDEDTIRPVLLVRYVTMAGNEGLWPIKIDPPDRKANSWNRSAKTILKIADEGKWIRMRSMIAQGQYLYTTSKRTFEEAPPQPSARTFKQIVDAIFEGRKVSTPDHEIWDELANGKPA